MPPGTCCLPPCRTPERRPHRSQMLTPSCTHLFSPSQQPLGSLNLPCIACMPPQEPLKDAHDWQDPSCSVMHCDALNECARGVHVLFASDALEGYCESSSNTSEDRKIPSLHPRPSLLKGLHLFNHVCNTRCLGTLSHWTCPDSG